MVPANIWTLAEISLGVANFWTMMQLSASIWARNWLNPLKFIPSVHIVTVTRTNFFFVWRGAAKFVCEYNVDGLTHLL